MATVPAETAAALMAEPAPTEQPSHTPEGVATPIGMAGVAASAHTLAPQEQVEIKLFVGRVPRYFEEEHLRPIFEEFGPVLEVAILKDRGTQHHKGSAFVRMESLTHGDAAIRALNDTKVLDPSLGAMNVRYATREGEKFGFSIDNGWAGTDQVKLFVGSLSRNISDAEVKALFSPFGTIDEVFLLKDPGTGLNKGCAFVKFAFKEQAIRAIRQLNGSMTLPGAMRPIEVRVAESKKAQLQATTGMPGAVPMAGRPMGTNFATPTAGSPTSTANPQAAAAAAAAVAANNANPRQGGSWKEYFTADGRPYYHNAMTNHTQWDRPAEFDRLATTVAAAAQRVGGDVTGPPGANIFIFHIPNEWTQYELLQNFSHFGNVVSARIATDKTTSRNKGYAFVSYDNIQSAAQAVTHMNGFMAGGKRLKVSIKQNEDRYVAHLIPPQNGMASPTMPQSTLQQPMQGYQQPQQMQQPAGPYGAMPAQYHQQQVGAAGQPGAYHNAAMMAAPGAAAGTPGQPIPPATPCGQPHVGAPAQQQQAPQYAMYGATAGTATPGVQRYGPY